MHATWTGRPVEESIVEIYPGARPGVGPLPMRRYGRCRRRCGGTWWPDTADTCDNRGVAEHSADPLELRHVVVVGGSIAEWNQLSEAQWEERMRELGKAADHFGASWLTVRPYLAGDGAGCVREKTVGRCRITVDPEGDGRSRLLSVLNGLRTDGVYISEQSVARRINAPAEVDPDLVMVLGPPTRMPPSLVWELAYSELVFVDVAWADLQASHLEQAVGDFASRHRRFGGID
jgi:hypothetical protein